MDQSLDGYTVPSPASESDNSQSTINELVENMERDFTMFEAGAPDFTMVSPTASSGSSSLHVQGARGPKSRRVEVGYQSLLVVVTTESLCLIGATWVHSKITQPSGAVVRVWKHQLPDPSADGAPARLDPKDQPLGWGSWQPGICLRYILLLKYTSARWRAIMPSSDAKFYLVKRLWLKNPMLLNSLPNSLL
ncbi:hypothetical protein FIBSPDRAFT_900226 [Athelia psychrophila]|uniref:Uncharacterized protein n=1 Tax=Athelia psychrophila TaxID=1759441 RepID=A0A165YQG7_9AGAM|nr:hypothetical protein FIBSPDRAFT_900226 [Fibularhizoctonia sp. CBS 109695]